jgi:beta-lactamase class A
MSPRVSRRHLLAAIAAIVASPRAGRARAAGPVDALKALEAGAGGRLGVCILDTKSGHAQGHRLDERFAMCSTFKLPLAGVVLREADAGRLKLTERTAFSEKDLVPHAPVTSQHLRTGWMTVEALAEAAQLTSDNVAANLLLERLGGPPGFTALLREAGDTTTRLERYEPMMNLVLPGEARDTTTPRAMATTVAAFVVGNRLTPASREKLAAWTIATRTGDKRIRAGLPRDWRAGDKTGTASSDRMTNKINDVAIVWPPNRSAIVVAAYFDSSRKSAEIRDEEQAVLAAVGRIAAESIGG